MNAPTKPPLRNYEMAELKALYMAHHLPAQID